MSTPPIAERRPVTSELHGVTRTDDFAWLRDREDPAVIAHLEAENTYTAEAMAPTEALQETLFTEIKARVQETDLSVPTRKGPWEYFTRTEEGRQYAIHGRRPLGAPENGPHDQLLLDENALAEGHEYFALGTFEISPDHAMLAYALDTSGEEQYVLRVRDIATGVDGPEQIANTSPGVAWSADSTRLFYATLDDVMRPDRLWLHTLGSPGGEADDANVFTEPDERFYLGVGTSATDELIVLTLGSQVTTEVWLLRAADPDAAFAVVEPRRQDIEYGVDHHRSADGSERLFIVTNSGEESFRMMIAPVDTPGQANWVEAVPGGTPGPVTGYPTKLDGIDLFRNHVILHERCDGLERLRVVELDASGALGAEHVIDQPEPVHTVWSNGNAEFDTDVLRFGYTSPITPTSVFDYDLRNRQRTLRKEQPVLGGFDRSQYVCDRVWATAPDGVRVPMSVVRRRDRPVDGTGPALLYGYGSYEISVDPTFSFVRLSLLDRGFVVAIAHIRGGGELGRRWYLDGKYRNKQNTFSDFIACGEHLVREGWCASDKLIARGGSAGGLLMGAVTNLRPDLWRAVVAEVPFVDVINTMLDDTLPLTAIEWEEWGNPADPVYFNYMRAYAPYENVAEDASGYPELLITGGLNDPRVGFWEPAKWVAKLRQRGAGGSGRRLLAKTELGAGHGGPSGRYAVWRDESFVLAFMISAIADPDA